ncbi:hypothetical protein RN001_006225 [Aquatica leii]|uniref:RING-type E3 ubiquitin transferase n=1 Tax=Aquatica leii TaxID=1421715 RepID=A0AAN7PKX5_9COLE|nr:hypothetical protein RN001_006225 [Aquatica leii]
MVDYFQERGFNTVEDADRSREEELERHIMRLMADFNLFDEMGMPNQLAPPASPEIVNNLPEEKIQETNCGKCDICLKEYEKDETVKIIPCKHKFHSECIIAWLTKTNSCPLCRHELPTSDPIYEQYRKEKKRQKEREIDIENLHNSMFS